VSDEARGRTAELPPLELEARVFSRYLVGRLARETLRARYAEAVRTLLPAPASTRDEAIVAFARRHPWSVSLPDAACGLARPRARLREKILVMAAVLEASPDFADEFLPRTASRGILLARLAGLGTGRFTGCVDERYPQPTAEDVVEEIASALRIPFVSGLPFGHCKDNRAWPVGARATLDGGAGTLELIESGVSVVGSR